MTGMISTYGQEDWNIVIVNNTLKQTVRARTDLWPHEYSFPNAIASYVVSCNELEQLHM